MRRLILALVFLFAGAVNAQAQSTTVSGTVTDTGAQAWAGGAYRFSFTPNPQFPTGPYTWTGGTLNLVIAGTLDGSGHYSVSIPSNTAISPQGSTWILQVCPNATSPCFSTPKTTITGGTQTLNVTPTAIAIPWTNPPGPAISAYADGEIVGTLPKGAEYFNVTSGLTRLWNGTTWANQGAGGGGGVTGSGTTNTIAVWTGTGSIGDSEITDDGAGTVTANADLVVAANFGFILGQDGSSYGTYLAGATITNGTLVKFSGTAEQIVPTTNSDTGNVVIGVAEGISGSVGPGTPVIVSRIGTNAISLDNLGSCSANEPIVNSTTAAPQGHCTATPGAAQVVGTFINDPGNLNIDIYPLVKTPTLVSATNCSSGASPAVCGSAAAGSVAVPAGATPTLVIDTTAVTANSQILLTIDESLGTKLSVTCNTTLSTLVQPVVTARTAGTSFTIQINATLATNPACVSYAIIN